MLIINTGQCLIYELTI